MIDSWVVSPDVSEHDLDNIKLSVGESCRATFRLKNILVQGHAKELKSKGPPRGLQFVLGKKGEDTITMANLGYIQLKANPGLSEFGIRGGRSSLVYEIDSISSKRGSVMKNSDGTFSIPVISFEGPTIYPVVRRQILKELGPSSPRDGEC